MRLKRSRGSVILLAEHLVYETKDSCFVQFKVICREIFSSQENPPNGSRYTKAYLICVRCATVNIKGSHFGSSIFIHRCCESSVITDQNKRIKTHSSSGVFKDRPVCGSVAGVILSIICSWNKAGKKIKTKNKINKKAFVLGIYFNISV